MWRWFFSLLPLVVVAVAVGTVALALLPWPLFGMWAFVAIIAVTIAALMLWPVKA